MDQRDLCALTWVSTLLAIWHSYRVGKWHHQISSIDDRTCSSLQMGKGWDFAWCMRRTWSRMPSESKQFYHPSLSGSLSTEHLHIKLTFIIQDFGLLSSSVLLFSQRFGQYVLRPSSGICRTREPTRNFELRPLLNPRGSPALIPLAITGYQC